MGTALETDRFLQTVLDQMPEGILAVGASGRILFANPAAEQILGRPLRSGGSIEESLSDLRFFTREGEPYPIEETPLARYPGDGVAVHEEELTVERADGTRVSLLASVVPIAVPGTESQPPESPSAAMTVLQDIGERRRQEAALRETVARLGQAQERQRRLGEITRAISASLDLEQVLEMIRRAVIEALGFDRAGIFLVDEERRLIRGVCGTNREGNREEISGSEFGLDTDLDGPMQRIWRREIDYFLTDDWDRDGRWPEGHPSRGVKAHALVPFRAGERILGILAVDNLLTGRPINEEEVQELFLFANTAAIAIQNARLYAAVAAHRSDLEAALTARTAELECAQEQLLQSEKLAAIGTFAARLVHDLRNPLNVFQLNLQLLRRRAGEDPQLMRPLDRLDQAADQAAAMLTDLLDLAGLTAPRVAPMRIDALLRRVMAERAWPEGVRATVECQPDLPSVSADSEQLYRALRHMISNALRALGEEGGEITLAARRVGPEVALEVRDTGTGIEPQVLPRIYEPLFTTLPRGTGLGLTVCRRIIESHGGLIDVESTPGAGTTFRIRLPLTL